MTKKPVQETPIPELDFGRGPEPAAAITVDGETHYISALSWIQKTDAIIDKSQAVFATPEGQDFFRRLDNKEFRR